MSFLDCGWFVSGSLDYPGRLPELKNLVYIVIWTLIGHFMTDANEYLIVRNGGIHRTIPPLLWWHSSFDNRRSHRFSVTFPTTRAIFFLVIHSGWSENRFQGEGQDTLNGSATHWPPIILLIHCIWRVTCLSSGLRASRCQFVFSNFSDYPRK